MIFNYGYKNEDVLSFLQDIWERFSGRISISPLLMTLLLYFVTESAYLWILLITENNLLFCMSTSERHKTYFFLISNQFIEQIEH